MGHLAQRHPQLGVSLSLDGRLVDVVGGATDVAIRIGGLAASGGATMCKLADNRQILVAAPGYLDRAGRSAEPGALPTHDLLRYGDAVGPWRLWNRHGREQLVPADARMRVDNGDAVHAWRIAGLGITLKPQVDVASDLRTRALEHVLSEWHAGDSPIVALFPDRATIPRKTHVFLDAMVVALE